MFRWLVNAGFLALPIATTLGILIALEAHRHATGQAPLFAPHLDNKWVVKSYRQKSMGIHPETKGQEFTLNPNQWGWDEGGAGFLTMNVTTFNNQTYATKNTAPQFNVVWQYPNETPKKYVHAFPNIKVDGDVLPAKTSSISGVDVDMAWSMRLDNKTGETASADDLTAADVNSNVAIDMFLDSDKSKAADSADAGYEIMVWFASFGPGTYTVGQENGTVGTKTIDGTKFNLYHGSVKKGQWVLTWKTTEAASNFNGDIWPLVHDVLQTDKPHYPSADDYLGYLSFGSEAYWSKKPVTFSVPSLSIDIRKS